MSYNAIQILTRFENLVKLKNITGFNIELLQHGLLIKSDDGSRELTVELDNETLSSLRIFFDGVAVIQYNSYDYISLTSIINAKSILERMLHNKNSY
jgi:hypothetical protein